MPEAIVFLSPVRWEADPAWQKLPSRCAREHHVIVVEEPLFDAREPELELRREDLLVIATPHFEDGSAPEVVELAQKKMLACALAELPTRRPVLWYRTANALAFTHHVRPRAIVYDPGQGATPCAHDQLLRQHADVVVADPARDLPWHEVWPLVDRAIAARSMRSSGMYAVADAAVMLR